MTRGRAVFRRHHRLSRALDYRAVFDAGLRSGAGPITVFVRPNGLGHPRLGLSIGRRVGPAVSRVAVKRRVRDAFRFMAAEWPDNRPSLDMIVSARAHELRTPAEYRSLIEQALDRLRRPLARRVGRVESEKDQAKNDGAGP
ncbi:MAG: ribonuclease P protein component [Planctomycetota bacterium]